MQHLTIEVLARIVDETPAPAEKLHLAVCAACRGELQLLRRQTAALAALPSYRAPANGWDRLSRSIAAGEGAPRQVERFGGGWLSMRAAAAVAIFLVGGTAGLLAGRASAPAAAPSPPLAQSTLVLNAEDAAQRLRSAEAAYVAALARYSELTGASAEADPVARLVALEGILLSAGAALEEAPADPFINGYYLTATSQREAVIRQITNVADEDWF
jgi:hypothetical protein